MKKILATVLAVSLALTTCFAASTVSAEATNLALNATATADSVHATYGGDPEDAIDGNMTTRWQSNAKMTAEDPCWLTLDLGKATSINEVDIYWETNRPTDEGYVIQVSNDNANWTDVTGNYAAQQQVEGKDSTYYSKVTFDAVSAQYVRVYCVNGEHDGGVKDAASIWEIEIYGDGSAPVVSEPDTSVPDASEPDTSVPDASEPAVSEPDASEPEAPVVEKDFVLELSADKVEGLKVGDTVKVTITPNKIKNEYGIVSYDISSLTYDASVLEYDGVEMVGSFDGEWEVKASAKEGVIKLMATDNTDEGLAAKNGEGACVITFKVLSEAKTVISLAGGDIAGTDGSEDLNGLEGTAGADLVLTNETTSQPDKPSNPGTPDDPSSVVTPSDDPSSVVTPSDDESEASTVVPVFDWKNIAPQATVTADSIHSQYGGDPKNVNDGDLTTRWQSAAKMKEDDPCWLVLDFGKAYTIKEVTIDWETSRAAEDGYVLQVSNDGKTWTDLDFTLAKRVETKDAGTPNDKGELSSRFTDVATFAETETQYLRVYCTKGVSYDGGVKEEASIWEISVLGLVEAGTNIVPDNGNNGDNTNTGVGTIAITFIILLAAASVVFATAKARRA